MHLLTIPVAGLLPIAALKHAVFCSISPVFYKTGDCLEQHAAMSSQLYTKKKELLRKPNAT